MLRLISLLPIMAVAAAELPDYPSPRAATLRGVATAATQDTLLVETERGDRRITLAGIDASRNPTRATTALRELATGEPLRWRMVGPRALVFREPDGLCLNAELVRRGAVAAGDTGGADGPVLAAYEAHARARAVGIWAAEAPDPGGVPGMVYITRTGTRYHRADCPHARESGRPIPRAEAAARFKPCGRCRPAMHELSTEPSTAARSPADGG